MLAYLFVIFAVLSRMPFMPHPWNFAPLTASLLYFGARGPRRQWLIPFALLVASDVILTRLVYAYHLTWDQLVVWAWYAAMLWLGTNLRENADLREQKDWLRVGGASLVGSVSFFLVSNFAVWAAWPTYPKTVGGLMACYAAGIPFFRHTVAGDLLFTAVFFGSVALYHALSSERAESGRIAAA
jgi:hypothetical protein